MKRYRVKVIWHRLRRIPLKNYFVLVFLGILSLYSIIQLFFPMYQTLDHLNERKIQIDSIYLKNTSNIFFLGAGSSGMQLNMISGDNTYYVSYSRYRDFAGLIESELLSGKVTSVSVQVPEKQMIRDRLCHRFRVAELRSETSVFYSLDEERSSLKDIYYGNWILFALAFPLLIFLIFMNLIIYKVVLVYKKK